jgi:hypothetical protein
MKHAALGLLSATALVGACAQTPAPAPAAPAHGIQEGALPVDPAHQDHSVASPAVGEATEAPPVAKKSRFDNTQSVAGASCKGYGRPFSAAHGAPAFKRTGDTWISQEIRGGGGCPKRAAFTLAYTPKTENGKSVLVAHVCEDVEADPCEMAWTGTISFDLSKELAANHATDVTFVDP